MAEKNLLQRILSAIPKAKHGDVDLPFATLFQTQFNEMFGVTARQQFVKAYRGWVFACTQAISTEVANIEIKLFRKTSDGPEEVFDHELLDLLNAVNPRMTRHELIENTQSYLELEGNAFWFLARDKMGKIRQIWPLRPDRVTFTQDKEVPVMIEKFIYRQKDGSKTVFEPENIVHFANFNAEGDYPFPVRGKGTVEAAGLSIDTNEFAREWNARFFKNSARPDMIFKAPGTLGPDEYENLKRKINSAFQGVDKSHKMLLLQGGLEVDKISNSQKDMDFVKQVIQTRDEILAIFRVPKSILGIVEDVNRANAEAQIFTFAKLTIEPKMRKFIGNLNEFLIPKVAGEDSDLFFGFVSPVPENRERIIEEYDKGHNKWLTTNDIRRAEGLPESENGDEFRGGPLQSIPVDTVPEQSKQIEKPKRAEKKKYKSSADAIANETREQIKKIFDKKNGEADEKAEAEAEKEKELRAMTFAEIQKYGEVWMKTIERGTNAFEPLLKVYFEDEEKKVIKAITEELKGLEQKEYSLKQVDDLLPGELRNSQISSLITIMEPPFADIVREAGQNQLDTLNTDFVFDFDDPTVQAFIKERSAFFADSINDTTFEKLITEVQAGIDAGETLDDISERVAGVYKNIEDFRIRMIARTEVSAASNFAANEALKQAEIDLKQWVNFSPVDDDDAHCGPVPDTVKVGEVFSNGLETAPVHPNCVCTVIAAFE